MHIHTVFYVSLLDSAGEDLLLEQNVHLPPPVKVNRKDFRLSYLTTMVAVTRKVDRVHTVELKTHDNIWNAEQLTKEFHQ